MNQLSSLNGELENTYDLITPSKLRVLKQTLSQDDLILIPSIHFSELGECEDLIKFCACSVRFEPATKLRTANIYPHYSEEIDNNIL